MAVQVVIERSFSNPPTTVRVTGDTVAEAVTAVNDVEAELYPNVILPVTDPIEEIV